MKFRRFTLLILFAAIFTVQGNLGTGGYGHHDLDQPYVGIGHVPLQSRAPAFSSPQVEIAPNGDRVGHYPPYYHPERD